MVSQAWQGICEELGKTPLTDPKLLKEYSPWLDSFQASNFSHKMEIPGQYKGTQK
jgi:hypothetical protein